MQYTGKSVCDAASRRQLKHYTKSECSCCTCIEVTRHCRLAIKKCTRPMQTYIEAYSMGNRSTHRWPRHWECYPDKQVTVTHLISNAGWHVRVAVRAKCSDFKPCSPADCCRNQQPRLARPHPHAASAPTHMLLPCQQPWVRMQQSAQ